jgi:REP element-mobilizing transposase RayT
MGTGTLPPQRTKPFCYLLLLPSPPIVYFWRQPANLRIRPGTSAIQLPTHIYDYVVMPEHVHLLLSEPQPVGGPLKPGFGLSGNAGWLNKAQQHTLADALKALKQGVARRLIGEAEHFWQKRYYDFNVRDYTQFLEKLRYIHFNPVKARNVSAAGKSGNGAAFGTMQPDLRGAWRSNRSGQQTSANARRVNSVRLSNCPTQAKPGLEWATCP